MEYQVAIYSADAVFARMLELETDACGKSVRVLKAPDASIVSEVALVDLDSAEPPFLHTYQRMIGFSREPALIEEEIRRRCSMILHRPFEMRALREEILSGESGTAMPRQRTQTTEAERLVLEVEKRRLELDGRAVLLTPTELLIVERLLENRGVAVTRETLDALIGVSENNKTDVYVCYLRRKLLELTRMPLIRTVRGKGYMIE